MAAPALLSERPPAARAALRRRLEALTRRFDATWIPTDPVALVHRYDAPADREIAAFLVAGLAFGNVVAIQASAGALLAALGPCPARFVDDFDTRSASSLEGLYHRWIRSADLVLLLRTLRRMREEAGSLRGFFLRGHRADHEDVGPALRAFSEGALAFAREARGGASGWAIPTGGTIGSFFPSPAAGSACKRLNLFLRWMVRADGVDFGLWPEVPARQLVLPLDTHLARLSRALGLTRRKSPGWTMAVEATRSLALLDAEDPVKYDFALCRLGILDLCLHGRDPLECRRCPPPAARVRRAGQMRRAASGLAPAAPPARGRTRTRAAC